MKEFVVYTLLRILLFVTAVGIVGGIWSLATGLNQVPALWVVVIAFLVSGLASMFLLDKQREAFARRVEARAAKASAKFEQIRAAEDDDEDGPAARG